MSTSNTSKYAELKPIIFYDIPSKLPIIAWSPNTWKTRYTLNIKGLQYRTEWVEYPDIGALCQKIGAPPISTWPDGRPLYTLPAIFDPNTNRGIADSLKIAAYLDMQYPETTPLVHIPTSTTTTTTDTGRIPIRVLLAGFRRGFFEAALEHIWQFHLPRVVQILNEPSEVYFRRTREEEYGKTLEDVVPKRDGSGEWEREWKKAEKGFGIVGRWYEDHGEGEAQTYVLGDRLTFADVEVAGYVMWTKIIFGEESEEWKMMSSWSGGRWGRLIKDLEKYEKVV